MALRVLARRLSGPQVQQQGVLRPGRQQIRGFAEEQYTGKGLNEKEKAAEGRYIRKLEEEQRLKSAAAAASHVAADATSATGTGVPTKPEYPGPTAEGGFRNTAVVAGLIAMVAGYWLFSRSPKEKKESS